MPRQTRRKEFELALSDGGVLARQASGFLADGAFWFEDTLAIPAALTTPILMSAAWLLELYALDTGTLRFVSGPALVGPRTRTCGVFYAPFTLAQATFERVTGRVVGVAGTAPLPAGLAGTPWVFDTDFAGRPTSAAHVFEIVQAGCERQAIPLNPSPSLLSLKAKRLIDDNYRMYPAIGRIAARLEVTPAHLSRQFKRDYGLTPSHYLRQVRVADALLPLARGEAIATVSQDVGYNDLSRFYKQFRDTNLTSPGACQQQG